MEAPLTIVPRSTPRRRQPTTTVARVITRMDAVITHHRLVTMRHSLATIRRHGITNRRRVITQGQVTGPIHTRVEVTAGGMAGMGVVPITEVAAAVTVKCFEKKAAHYAPFFLPFVVTVRFNSYLWVSRCISLRKAVVYAA